MIWITAFPAWTNRDLLHMLINIAGFVPECGKEQIKFDLAKNDK
jgi:hypothetical protein